jgi:tetratricopeptide (TPR) repeat protein
VALHLAQSHAAIGDRVTALARLTEAEQLLPDDRTAIFERTRTRAKVDYFTRDFRSAVVHWERAVDMARDMGLTYQVMASLHNVGDVLIQLDDLPRAYGALRQSLALSEEYGIERLANLNRMFLAFLDGIRGAVDGDKLLRQGIAYAESKDFTNDVVSGRALLAKLLHRLGHLDAAREEYIKTRAIAVTAGHRIVVDECDAAVKKLPAARPESAE